jgi:hypothetical protein
MSVKRWLRIAFAANALAFAGLLMAFLITLFAKGFASADQVWGAPAYYVPIWLASIALCVKYLKT